MCVCVSASVRASRSGALRVRSFGLELVDDVRRLVATSPHPGKDERGEGRTVQTLAEAHDVLSDEEVLQHSAIEGGRTGHAAQMG